MGNWYGSYALLSCSGIGLWTSKKGPLNRYIFKQFGPGPSNLTMPTLSTLLARFTNGRILYTHFLWWWSFDQGLSNLTTMQNLSLFYFIQYNCTCMWPGPGPFLQLNNRIEQLLMQTPDLIENCHTLQTGQIWSFEVGPLPCSTSLSSSGTFLAVCWVW